MNKHKKYFVKQKLIGLIFLLASFVAIFIVKEGTIALIMIPMGLALIFSKEMIWKNRYYYEVMDEEDWE